MTMNYCRGELKAVCWGDSYKDSKIPWARIEQIRQVAV